MNNALITRFASSRALRGGQYFGSRKETGNYASLRQQCIKLLEEHIGHPLFVRTTRRIELAETGQLLLEQTAAAVESLENHLKAFATSIRSPLGWCANYALAFCLLLILKPAMAEILSAISGHTVRNFGLRRYREYHPKSVLIWGSVLAIF